MMGCSLLQADGYQVAIYIFSSLPWISPWNRIDSNQNFFSVDLVSRRIVPRDCARTLLLGDRMDMCELMSMDRTKPLEAVAEEDQQAIVTVPAVPSPSAASSATLHHGLLGFPLVTPLQLEAIVQRDRGTIQTWLLKMEVDSGARLVTALEGTGGLEGN
jgi:hypothetical protein